MTSINNVGFYGNYGNYPVQKPDVDEPKTNAPKDEVVQPQTSEVPESDIWAFLGANGVSFATPVTPAGTVDPSAEARIAASMATFEANVDAILKEFPGISPEAAAEIAANM